MRQLVEELETLVNELSVALEFESDELVMAYTGEPQPYDIDFIYQPPYQATAQGNQPAELLSDAANGSTIAQAAGTPALEPRPNLAINESCNECSDRLFAVRNFQRIGKLPILVLHYNGPTTAATTTSRRDLSEKFIFGDQQSDDLFFRMCQAANIDPRQLHYQEYPGCFFNGSRSLPEDWNRRCRNCLDHVSRLIKNEGVKLLLVTGPAAIFLLSEEMARKLAVSGEKIPLPFGDREVGTLVIRSPAALLAMEEKRKQLKLAGNELQYQQVLDEEKKVKRAILDSLNRAMADVHGQE